MRMFGEFTKVERQDDGTLKVEGVASSETPDSAGDIMKADAIREAIPDYMRFGAVREMHQPTTAAGTALAIEVTDEGLTKFEALVVDSEAIKKVETGVYKGFSVGGSILKRNPKNKKIIEQIKLKEISLVDRPANPDATFTLAKLDSEEETMADAAKTTTDQPTGTDPQHETLAKWAGEEIGDAAMATRCLSDLFYLLTKEAGETPVEPDQVADLKTVVDRLKAFIAKEIVEDNGTPVAPDMLAAGDTGKADAGTGAGEEPLAKKGARHSAATKEALAKLKGAFEDCMKAMDLEKDDGEEDDGEEVDKGDHSEALAKVAGLEESLAKAETEKGEALAKVESLTTENEELKKGQAALIEETTALLDQMKAKGRLRVVGKGEDLGTLAKADGAGAREPETARDAILAAHRSGGMPATGR